MSAISKAIAKSQSSEPVAEKKDSAQRQLEAAEFYGAIKPDNPQVEQPRKRGRPRSTSKSPGPTKQPVPQEPPKQSFGKKASDENVNEAVNEMKKQALVCKIRAYVSYWPEICSESLKSINIYTCTVDQLEKICKGFEDTVHLQSEIVDIPRTFKKAIAKVEPIAIGIGYANRDHPLLGELSKLHGLTEAIESDPSIDKNVKLIAIRFMGSMPRNPYINLLVALVMCAFEVIKKNTVHYEPTGDSVPEGYDNL